MTKASKMRLKVASIIIIITVIVFLIFTFYVRRKYSQLLDNRSYHFTVQKIKKYRGYLYLNDSLQVPGYVINAGTSILDLSNFLKIGDKFSKEAGKEKIVISRNRDTFSFIYYR